MSEHLRASGAALLIAVLVSQPSRAQDAYDGAWSGETTNKHKLTFVVRDNAVVSLRLEYKFQGKIGDTPVEEAGMVEQPLAAGAGKIVSGEFALTGASTLRGREFTWKLTGKFTSPTEADGQVQLRLKDNKTIFEPIEVAHPWTALRTGDAPPPSEDPGPAAAPAASSGSSSNQHSSPSSPAALYLMVVLIVALCLVAVAFPSLRAERGGDDGD